MTPDRQKLFLNDLSAIIEPIVVAGVAVAPLVRVEAYPEQAALTLERPRHRPCPIVHDPVLPGGKVIKLVLFVTPVAANELKSLKSVTS